MSEALELGLVRRANEAKRREATYYILWIIDLFFIVSLELANKTPDYSK